MAGLYRAFRASGSVISQTLKFSASKCTNISFAGAGLDCLKPAASVQSDLIRFAGTSLIQARCCSSSGAPPKYNAYPRLEETPSPYKIRIPQNFGFKQRTWGGGVLPRLEKTEKVRSTPKIDWKKRDQWSRKKALFGQNDYIDILGDGSQHPAIVNYYGPPFLRAFSGNELQRLVRMMKFEGTMLQDVHPGHYEEKHKRMWYLYRRLNRRQKKPSHYNMPCRRFNLRNRK